jgi:hypothetical protein
MSIRRVVGVQRRHHEVAGLRGLHRDLRRFRVADFAKQDDVGVLPQNRSQRAGEGELDLLVDLRLVYARDLVFDRILDRDDVGLLRLHRPQRRAQRRRLPAAGGADDQNHPVLMAEELAHLFERRRRHPDLLDRRHALAVIEDAHHHFLAKERPQSGHAEVDFGAVLGGRAQPAVLRQPLLGDVHTRHDLQARDQSLMHPLRQVHDLLEQAVEAMPDEDTLFHRLDVDVARLALDRALDDEIDQVDDWRRLAAFLQPGDRFEDFLFHAARQRGLRGGYLDARPARPSAGRRRHRQLAAALGCRPHQRFVGVARLNGFVDVVAGRDHLLDAIAGLELEVLDEAEEQRIGHRDRQQVFFEGRGDADAFQRDFFGNQDDRGRVRRVFGQVDVRKSELECQRLRYLFFRRKVHPYEHHADAFAGTLVLCQSRLEVVFRNEAGLNQALTDLLAQLSASVSVSDCVEPTSDCTRRFRPNQSETKRSAWLFVT